MLDRSGSYELSVCEENPSPQLEKSHVHMCPPKKRTREQKQPKVDVSAGKHLVIFKKSHVCSWDGTSVSMEDSNDR